MAKRVYDRIQNISEQKLVERCEMVRNERPPDFVHDEISTSLETAVIREAVNDLKYFFEHLNNQRKPPKVTLGRAEHAMTWILSDDDSPSLLTFDDCCQSLRCDRDVMRKEILTQLEVCGSSLLSLLREYETT